MARVLHNFFPVHFMLRPPPLLAVCLIGFVAALRAEPAPGEAEIGAMRFKLTRPASGAADAWFEAEVDVDARPAPDSLAGLLGRVRVMLTLAAEIVTAGAPRRLEFYRASAEAVALKAGHNSVRFYLPSEIVARDAVRGDLRFWSADVAVGGSPSAPSRTRFSAALGSAESRKNFIQQAMATAAANYGILLPQYLTPFAPDYPTATPAFVRREQGG